MFFSLELDHMFFCSCSYGILLHTSIVNAFSALMYKFILYSIHVLGGIVALGKFDALHIGHRELAMHASKAGPPFLLSFVGMAEVLGWTYR